MLSHYQLENDRFDKKIGQGFRVQPEKGNTESVLIDYLEIRCGGVYTRTIQIKLCTNNYGTGLRGEVWLSAFQNGA